MLRVGIPLDAHPLDRALSSCRLRVITISDAAFVSNLAAIGQLAPIRQLYGTAVLPEDERRTRAIAARFNLRYIGILGILVEAKSRGPAPGHPAPAGSATKPRWVLDARLPVRSRAGSCWRSFRRRRGSGHSGV